MKKRIYGLETEYGIIFVYNGGKWDSDGPEFHSAIEYFKKNSDTNIHQFKRNGSRIYLDLAVHPEYCTAECLNPHDLVAHDKAGERILNRIFNQSTEIHENGSIHLFKNNVQHAEGSEINDSGIPITFGCHENYLATNFEELEVEKLAPVLVPFLVVRQIIAGAGWVANFSDSQFKNVKYTISQRDRFIREKVSSSTHGGWARAILCTARWQESLANSEKYRRLHLIVGDSNMSELSTYLKTATIGILLEILEETSYFGTRLSSFAPKDSVKALHLVSQDLTCKKPVIELENWKSISALDLFWKYIEIMEEYERTEGFDRELSNALKILIDVLERLEKRVIDRETLMEIDSQGLDEELDWLIKKSILEDSLRRFGCSWNDFEGKKIHSNEAGRDVSIYDQLRYKDKMYHDISEKGLYNIFVDEPDLSPAELKAAQIRTPRVVRREEIENMEDNPPQNTRAKLRGEFIKFAEEKNIRDKFIVDWGTIQGTYYPNTIIVDLKDPLVTESEELKRLKARF